MTRVKTGVTRHQHHKKIFRLTKGFRMSKNRLFKVAREATLHAGEYAFAGRRDKKNQFRRIWIQRINAALSQQETSMSYSHFIAALKAKNIALDRKSLAALAHTLPQSFTAVFKQLE